MNDKTAHMLVPDRALGTAPADALSGALESELRYFEAAALSAHGSGWRFSALPGLGALAAGAVAFLDSAIPPKDLEDALLDLEDRFRVLGASYFRFYAEPQNAAVASLLTARGYAARTETIFARPIPGGGHMPRPDLMVARIEGDAAWRARLQLQRATMETSDGHASVPELWVEMERRKCENGGMESFLFRLQGEVVAAAGIVRCPPGTARLKNILVHRDYRRKGIGTTAIEVISLKGDAAGAKHLVTFAVSGSIGEKLYLKLGFSAIGALVEWLRPVSPSSLGPK
jgi:GNAT superfamily N-acetyltransferase